ncbi:MAG: chromate transporter [Treponema sp.]|jgi:chromate transporter|nr:chromate transporter [Treponema sp.]
MPEPRLKRWARLAGLYAVFFKIGAITFGGGLAMLPILERELAVKRDWTTGEDLMDYYAIGQSTPGIIAVNVATFIGFKRAGVLGAVTATAGMVSPSLIIITALAASLETFTHIPTVRKALTGINVAVAALLTHAVWSFGKKAVTNIAGAVLFLAAFAALFFFKVNSVLVILISAGSGVVLWALKNRKAAGKGEGQ